MQYYKISFNLASAISFIDLPVFDALLAYCYMKEKDGSVQQRLSIPKEELESFDDLPLIRHSDGYFLASWMQFDYNKAAEFTGSWKKRWANQYDFLADFGKKVRKVRINAGEYKSYDMPLVLHSIKTVWFYFASNDIVRVEYLLRHLRGIGKKTSQGKGEISGFHIESVNYNPFDKVIRPIPAKESGLKESISVRMMAWRPPYWLSENQSFCLSPE